MWCEQYPEFKEAAEIGAEAALVFWERIVRKGYMEDKDAPEKINFKIVSFYLKNRFPADWMNEKFFKLPDAAPKGPSLDDFYIETSDGKKHYY